MTKKYLIYDNLVKGAGIGHSLCSYAYGMELAQKKNLIYIPNLMTCGHGLGDNGFLENLLGLPIYFNERKALLSNAISEVEHIEYKNDEEQPTIDFLRHKDKFLDFFKSSQLAKSKTSLQNSFNISITIRRGDIAIHYPKNHPFRTRLRSTHFYLNALKKIISDCRLKDFHIHIFTDSRHEYCVDEFGKKQDYLDVFKEFKGKININIDNRSKDGVFNAMSTCIYSNIFIGSISGFSDIICMYRNNKDCYLPVCNVNRKNEFHKKQ